MPVPYSQNFVSLQNDKFEKVDFEKIKSLTKELSFSELLETYPKLLKGEYFGRAIVNPNK